MVEAIERTCSIERALMNVDTIFHLGYNSFQRVNLISFQVWFLFSLDEPHALSLSWDGPRIQRNWHYLTISVTRLGLLPGSSQFHNSIKLEERNASSSKCLLKLLLFVHGVMSVSLNVLGSFLPFLSETAGPTNQRDRKPHMFRCSDSERYFVKDISLWFSFWASEMEGRSGYSVLCLLAGISMTEELLRVIVTSVTMSLLRLEPLLRAFLLCGVMGSVLCKVNI